MFVQFIFIQKNLVHGQRKRNLEHRDSMVSGRINSIVSRKWATIYWQAARFHWCALLCPSCDLSVPVVRILNSQTAQHESKGRLCDGRQNIAIVVTRLPCSKHHFQYVTSSAAAVVRQCVDLLVGGQLGNNQFAINQSAPRQQRSVCRRKKDPSTHTLFFSFIPFCTLATRSWFLGLCWS